MEETWSMEPFYRVASVANSVCAVHVEQCKCLMQLQTIDLRTESRIKHAGKL